MKGFELVFFRHGIAADTVPDSSRPLTEEGIRKTYGSAEGLKKMAIPFDRVFTSPWLRASQTAAILSEVLMTPAPEEMPELAGDHTATELLEALQSCQGHSFLLVGHQPLLGDSIATLLGAPGRCEIDLRKSGACSVHLEALPPRKPAVLNWLLTSKQLRAVGK
jgi:phosphohistidine phosphatase